MAGIRYSYFDHDDEDIKVCVCERKREITYKFHSKVGFHLTENKKKPFRYTFIFTCHHHSCSWRFFSSLCPGHAFHVMYFNKNSIIRVKQKKNRESH